MRRAALLPALFVLLWCTGYLVVRIAMPDAGPVRFLSWRFGLAAVVVAVVSMTIGMLYQKRRCAHIDMITSTTVQLAVAGVAAFAAAWWIDDRPVEWNLRIFAALGWSVLLLSIGATLVLYMLLRRGDASRVASLLYLVPPLTAVMAWIGFGETLAPFTVVGMVLTATGVALVAGTGARGGKDIARYKGRMSDYAFG